MMCLAGLWMEHGRAAACTETGYDHSASAATLAVRVR
jgi:hypothetical protein